ncbi:MAG: TonB-dependent receptor [Saprospiraceae bacterium]|nr:TonB-dependent receptor [Saprospiraceae bacterium]
MIFRLIPILLFLLFQISSFAQNQKIVISGTIRDAENGETLIGASIRANALKLATISNEYGFYSIVIPQGTIEHDTVSLQFSYIGYIPQTIILDKIKSDSTFNISLTSGKMLSEVVVTANSAKERVNSTQMSVVTLTAEQAKLLPAFLGEVDILKTLQLKPGVLSGGEGVSGTFVRGGSADQNLFILDEAPVYNPSHLFGFFSTFNSDAVKNVELYKGGFPAQYGGKLSSVIDVTLKEGNRKKYQASGGLGLISSRLTVEGPLEKDKSSFVVSGRRTYVDLITNLYNNIKKDDSTFTKIPSYSFYDLNTKINFDLGAKDKLFLSGYFGKDQFVFNDDVFNFLFQWGNASGTVRWNHLITPKLFSNTVFTFSDYQYKIQNKFSEFSFLLGSGIRDYNFKNDFSWFPNTKNNVKFGVSVVDHHFLVSNFQAGASDGSFDYSAGTKKRAQEYGIYGNNDWQVNDKLSVNYGLRLSGFGANDKFYGGVEPRFSSKYSINENFSAKLSYGRMYQYIHLVGNSGSTLPTDIWYPSEKAVKPQFSDQVAGGLAYSLGDDYFLSVEGFYKWLHNQVDFKDNANLFVNDSLSNEFVRGKGWSYGGEFYIEKQSGKFTGWIGYSLTWAYRQFADINDGLVFHPRYDRRHDVNLVLIYKPSWRWTFSTVFSYGTGNAFSLPDGRYISFGNDYEPTFDVDSGQFLQLNIAPIYSERNKYRLPANWHWDVNVVYQLSKPTRRFQSDLTLSIYNVTDRRNPFFVYLAPIDENKDNIPDRVAAKQVSLFPILPTITWNFKF